MNADPGDRPAATIKWTERKNKETEVPAAETAEDSFDESLSRFHDHTDPEENLEAWSREVAEEEVRRDTM